MSKQLVELFFVGDAESPKTNQYTAISNDRGEAQRVADEAGLQVYAKMVDVSPRRRRRRK